MGKKRFSVPRGLKDRSQQEQKEKEKNEKKGMSQIITLNTIHTRPFRPRVLQTPHRRRKPMITARHAEDQYFLRIDPTHGNTPFARNLARGVDGVGAGDQGDDAVVAEALAHHFGEGGPGCGV